MDGPPSRTSWLWLGGLLIVFAVQVASTFSVFSDTVDERFHIEAGLEYFQRGVYEYEPQHPPLGRVAVGVLPYFVGGLRLTSERMVGLGGEFTRKPVDAARAPGESFLWAGMWKDAPPAEYWRTLSLARLGALFFGLLTVVLVFRWAYELYGERGALAASALAAFSPTLLAHSGLATLDAGATATGLAAAYGIWRWTERPDLRSATLAGALVGLAVCTKFSNLAYLPPAMLGYAALAWRKGTLAGISIRQTGAQLGAAALALSLVVLVAYRFDFGGVAEPGSVYAPQVQAAEGSLAETSAQLLGATPLPAPAFFRGLIELASHNADGHRSYLFGQWSDRGRLLYFPVALGVKTTLPMLGLALVSIVVAVRQHQLGTLTAPLIPLAATMAVAMAADINIGVRHILLAYPLLAIAAGRLFTDFSFRRSRLHWLLAALLVWHVASALRSRPDYLTYFNELAGSAPHGILLDSNLDWGQDTARLGEWARANGNPCVITRVFSASRPDKFGICNQILPPSHPDAGLIAYSVNYLLGMEGGTGQLAALARQPPVAMVGKTIYVYRIDPRTLPTIVPQWFLDNYEPVGKPPR